MKAPSTQAIERALIAACRSARDLRARLRRARLEAEMVGDPWEWHLIPAAFWFTAENYEGQADPLYALHCRISTAYNPGATERSSKDLREGAYLVHRDLVIAFARTPSI